MSKQMIFAKILQKMEKTFDTSNFEIDKPLPIGKNKISDWSNERWIRSTNHEQIQTTAVMKIKKQMAQKIVS